MTNLLDDPEGSFVVLRNGEEQYSLWPQSVAVPAGWQVAHPEDTRANCLAFIEAKWVDMRPLSVR
jgi:MbtH protein